MNIRKNVDYTEMYETLDWLMAQQLSQMELYCAIGKAVCQRTEKGAAVMAAEYLHKHYPGVPGFSPRNIRRMRDFYRIYENYPKLRKLAMQIGWIQNVVIMEADLSMELREWYLKATKQFGWSKAELIANIKAEAHKNITLEIDEEMCYNENKPVTSANTTIVFIAHMMQNLHQISRCWDNQRKEHRRRWRTMLRAVTTEDSCRNIENASCIKSVANQSKIWYNKHRWRCVQWVILNRSCGKWIALWLWKECRCILRIRPESANV